MKAQPRGRLGWHAENVRRAWRARASAGDALRRLRWTYAARLPFLLPAGEVEFGVRYPAPLGPLRFRVRGNRGADAFIFSEVFEERCYAFTLPWIPESVLDLGANIGFTSVFFSRCWPRARIAAVEPMPGNLELLRRNLALNRVDAEIIEGAVSAQDGELRMADGGHDYAHHVADDGMAVRGYRMDTLLARLGWSGVDLLKVDIEGEEVRLLGQDADWLRRVNALCVEWHGPGGAEALGSLARRQGYAPPRFERGLWLLSRERR